MSRNIDWTILKAVPLFENIRTSDEALKVLADLMESRKVSAGVTIIDEGKLGNEMFILTDGQVSIFKHTPDGDAYKVAVLNHQSNPALGEGGLIEDEPRSATVKTVGDCQFFVLNRDQFMTFAEGHPEWALPILRKIALMLMRRLRQTNNDLMLIHKALMHEIRT